jgi:DNA mismatch endonuclease (patch repair protein)
MPGTNVDYWRKKFDENIARDQRDIKALRDAGWRVAVVWGCSLNGNRKNTEEVARLVHEWLKVDDMFQIIPVEELDQY